MFGHKKSGLSFEDERISGKFLGCIKHYVFVLSLYCTSLGFYFTFHHFMIVLPILNFSSYMRQLHISASEMYMIV